MNSKKIKVIFMGTPVFACSVFKALLNLTEIEIIGIVSQPDRPVGRKKELKASPVKLLALEQKIPVWQPEKINDIFGELQSMDIDAFVTCAYGQFIPDRILALAKINALNVHASLLPKLRGGAPIHQAIIDNFATTGITLMKMIKRMDAGEIYVQESIEIAKSETMSSLHDHLQKVAFDLVGSSLVNVLRGKIPGQQQKEEEVTFAYNIKRDQERIDWSKSAAIIDCLVRGLYSWPIAYTTLPCGTIFKVHKAMVVNRVLPLEMQKMDNGTIVELNQDGILVKCYDNLLLLQVIQKAGKTAIDAGWYSHNRSDEIFVNQRFV